MQIVGRAVVGGRVVAPVKILPLLSCTGLFRCRVTLRLGFCSEDHRQFFVAASAQQDTDDEMFHYVTFALSGNLPGFLIISLLKSMSIAGQ